MKKKIIAVISAIFLSAIVLTGCATTRNIQGKPISSSAVNSITNGSTTKSQLVNIFGPPYSIKKNPFHPNTEIYKYKFSYYKYVHMGNQILTTSTKKFKEKLLVTIRKGIVVAHSFTTTGNTSLKHILKKQKEDDQ